MFIIFWKFLMADQIFFSPQVKRRVPISNKLVLPHELPHELKLRILGNRKYQENLHWTITPQPNPAPNKKPKTPPAPANPPPPKKKKKKLGPCQALCRKGVQTVNMRLPNQTRPIKNNFSWLTGHYIVNRRIALTGILSE